MKFLFEGSASRAASVPPVPPAEVPSARYGLSMTIVFVELIAGASATVILAHNLS
jgi:hypothetical protein